MQPSALLGLRTVVYHVSDLERAKTWYRALLGIEPYFDTPYYVGFNVGGFELGLHPAAEGQVVGPGGGVAYWGVERMADSWARALAMDARPLGPPNDVGEGILVAEIADPFGNPIGLIENRHFPNRA